MIHTEDRSTTACWRCPASTLQRLRTEREARKLSRMIYEGEIRRVLLDAQKTQHVFKKLTTHAGKVEPLLEFFNAVVIAHDLHADIMANEPATISVPKEFVRQRESINSLRDRALWDSIFHEACKTVSVEAYALLRADRDRRGRATLTLLDNEEWFPVGDPGEGGQPKVFERRWIIERKSADGRSTKRYLRIERHRERDEDGAYIVEQEAFAAESCDVLQCTAKLKPVPLAEAIPPGVEAPAELTVVALPEMPIVQLVNHRYRGKPRLRVSEHNIAIIDQSAASLSQLSRALSQHGAPKYRVTEKQVDEKTGTITISAEGFVDPDKAIEPIRVEFQFDAMISFLLTITKQMLISLEMSPALMGLKMGDGSNPDTVDKLRLESTVTLSAGNRAVPYMRPAIERVWAMACLIESISTPAGGWPVAPVQVQLHPQIPTDKIEKAREQRELREGGLTSRAEALRQVHGEDRAPQIAAEMDEEEDALAKRQQAAIFGAVGQSTSGTPFDDASTVDQPAVDEEVTVEPEIDTGDASGAASESVAADAVASGQKVADTAYTGIQIDKAIQYAERVRNGTMELATAIAHLTTFFPLTEEQATRLVKEEVGKPRASAPAQEVAA